MATWGGDKALSNAHEDFVAALYGGRRSASSGAADTDAGDVRVRGQNTLFECKRRGSTAKPLSSTPGIVTQMEKINDEAAAEGYEPALALRFYLPDSILADRSGWVDIVCRLAHDDARRLPND